MLLWDLTDPARPRRLGEPLTGHTDDVSAGAFAPDGRTLATASAAETDETVVLLWDLTDPARPRRLGVLRRGDPNRMGRRDGPGNVQSDDSLALAH